MAMSRTVEIPEDLLDLFTDRGTYALPRSPEGNDISVSSMRLRAYWARLAALAAGDKQRAAAWLRAYNWAVEQESERRRASVFAQMA